MKKRNKGIIIGIGVFLVLGVLMMRGATKDIPTIKALTINPVDITQIEDGEYQGKYELGRFLSEVNVTIKDGKIVDIKRLSAPLVKDVSEELFERMIQEQRVDVDTVSGATANSKANMKSVENALCHQE